METNEFGLVSYAEIAKVMGVKPKTVINYHSRAKLANYPSGPGRFPPPDCYIMGHPQWQPEVIIAMQQGRRGPGWFQKGEDRVPYYAQASREHP